MSNVPPSLPGRSSDKNRSQSRKRASFLFPLGERELQLYFRAFIGALEKRLALAAPTVIDPTAGADPPPFMGDATATIDSAAKSIGVYPGEYDPIDQLNEEYRRYIGYQLDGANYLGMLPAPAPLGQCRHFPDAVPVGDAAASSSSLSTHSSQHSSGSNRHVLG